MLGLAGCISNGYCVLQVCEASKIESETGAAVSLRDFIDPGIFEESRCLTPMLPQYHPKQLIGLLNFGKTSRVKAILAHLVKTIGEYVNLLSSCSKIN